MPTPTGFSSFDGYIDANQSRTLTATHLPQFNDYLAAGPNQAGSQASEVYHPSRFVVEDWRASVHIEGLIGNLVESRRQARVWQQEAEASREMAMMTAQRLREVREKSQRVDEVGVGDGAVEHLRLQLSKADTQRLLTDRKLDENNREIAELRARVERLELEASKFNATKQQLDATIERQREQLIKARLALSRAQGGLINALDDEQTHEAALGLANRASAESEEAKQKRIKILQEQCTKLQQSVQYWKSQNENATSQVGELSAKVSTLYRTMDIQEQRHQAELEEGKGVRHWWRGERDDVNKLRDDLEQARDASQQQSQALAKARAGKGY